MGIPECVTTLLRMRGYLHVSPSLSSSDKIKIVQAVQVLWEGKDELMLRGKAPGRVL